MVISSHSFSPGENVPVSYATKLTAPNPTTVKLCVGLVADDGSFDSTCE